MAAQSEDPDYFVLGGQFQLLDHNYFLIFVIKNKPPKACLSFGRLGFCLMSMEHQSLP